MARPRGSANKDSEARKRQIAEDIWQAMRRSKGKPLSWRKMAEVAGIGPATLAHHFGTRDEVVAAILEIKRQQGAAPLATLATPTSHDLETSLRDALEHLILGLSAFDVGDLVSLGLAESMHHQALGPQFVAQGLEPILEGFEERLRAHRDDGAVDSGADLRAAALMLACPILVTYLHQVPLGGRTQVPTDLSALAARLAAAVAKTLMPHPEA